MIAALSFLTVVGSGASPDGRSMRWFGFVGALIGGALGSLWWAASELTSPLLAAAIVVASDAAITGMLHLDGVADSGDGLLPHLPRERRLAVMSDPTIGAFGVIAAVLVLLLRVAAISSQSVSVVLLASLWCVSRAAMAITALVVVSARPHGISSLFVDGDRRVPIGCNLFAIAAAVGAVFAADSWRGLAAAGAVLAGSAATTALAHRRLGGYTGDTLGASGVIGETVALVVAAGRWS